VLIPQACCGLVGPIMAAIHKPTAPNASRALAMVHGATALFKRTSAGSRSPFEFLTQLVDGEINSVHDELFWSLLTFTWHHLTRESRFRKWCRNISYELVS